MKQFKLSVVYVAQRKDRVIYCSDYATLWMIVVCIQAGNGLFSSPKHPDQLWDPPSLLFNGYHGLFSLQ